MKKVTGILVFLLFLLSFTGVIGNGEPESQFGSMENVAEKDIFSKADSYIEEGDYESARKEYAKLKNLAAFGKELALFNIAESYRLEKKYARFHRTCNEILKIDNLTPYYRIYCLFRQAEAYLEKKDYKRARKLYGQIIKTEGALYHHIFTARLKIGDTCRAERRYSTARDIYAKLLREQENSEYPHDGYRLELRDRLEMIDGLPDGKTETGRQEKWMKLINSPKNEIYVAGGVSDKEGKGDDTNDGTKEKPFATIKRAQEEARKLKKNGMPKGGIAVYLRGGKYFLTESISFEKEDSGTKESPVVYRNYPGEEVRLIGGTQIKNLMILNDTDIMKKLPEEARGKVWTADLKESGITDYGKMANRGSERNAFSYILELFCNGKPMHLARWPNEGYARVASLVMPEGDGLIPGIPAPRGYYQNLRFCYSGDRPERWTEENDIWIQGYFSKEYYKVHTKIVSIETEKKIINMAPDMRYARANTKYHLVRVKVNAPYYVYNVLSEIDTPGEWYLDRETGKLYFYPPDDIESSEVVVSTLNTPIVRIDNASNIVLFGLIMEVTRSHGVEIRNGSSNLIAGSTIRNTEQWAVMIDNGWNNSIVGCDMSGMGEGGVSLNGGDRKKLIPAGHIVENNHVHHFNRFDGGYRQGVKIDGIGQRVSHNLIHDTPLQAIYFNANDHVIEFNELHDVCHEGRELGAVYIYGEPWYLMSRGNVIRNNFLHHISYHASPNLTQGLNAIHIDAINGGLVIEKNFFYRFPRGIANPQPENRIENNLFIEAEVHSIAQGNRSGLFNKGDGTPLFDRIDTLFDRYLKTVRFQQPPWSYRYPHVANMLSGRYPVGWTKDNVIERNINTGGPFMVVAQGVSMDENVISNNWNGDNPMFFDRGKMDFRLRPGSPVYGLTGCEPLATGDIGVYESPMRASWPVKRDKEDIGKYFRADWSPMTALVENTLMGPLKRVSPPADYSIPLRKAPINIDGKLEKEEWAGLDMNKAMVINQYHTGEKKEGAKSFAWLMYDADNLYIGVKNEPDPYREGMRLKAKSHTPLMEIALESQNGPHGEGWWLDDNVTGPIFSIFCRYNGDMTVNNLFGMPYEMARKIEKSSEYKVSIHDEENKVWTAEIKIPFASVGINPFEVTQLCFNLGVSKKAGWFAWIATGNTIWRVENAGYIKFAR